MTPNKEMHQALEADAAKTGKDRPILFSAPMVQALLAGTKTQTRRIIKEPYGTMELAADGWKPIHTKVRTGDRLWVKETWRTESRAYDDLAPSEMGGEETILYDADANWKANKTVGKSRVSIHMTRWASRITLLVSDVRVERLQDISADDAMAEGVVDMGRRDGAPYAHCTVLGVPGIIIEHDPEPVYAQLWEKINGEGSWDANPWVSVYSFSVIKQNIDQIGRAAA
jgi:hypothetical protein